MARYSVYYTTTATSVVLVEADSSEEAEDQSADLLNASLCHQCARNLDLGDFEVEAVEES